MNKWEGSRESVWIFPGFCQFFQEMFFAGNDVFERNDFQIFRSGVESGCIEMGAQSSNIFERNRTLDANAREDIVAYPAAFFPVEGCLFKCMAQLLFDVA